MRWLSTTSVLPAAGGVGEHDRPSAGLTPRSAKNPGTIERARTVSTPSLLRSATARGEVAAALRAARSSSAIQIE